MTTNVSQLRIVCPLGMTSDGMLRYSMPVGPFIESFGDDCYMHIVSFQVLAWILIVFASLVTLLFMLDLPFKKDKVLFKIVALMITASLCAIAVTVCGIFHQTLCRAFFAAECVFVLSWAHVFLHKIIHARVTLMRSMGSQASTVDLLGGKLIVYSAAFFLGSSTLLIWIGMIGAAVTYDPVNERVSFGFWQASCAGWFTLITSFAFFLRLIMLRIIRELEIVKTQTTNPEVQDTLTRMSNLVYFLPFMLPIGFTSILMMFFLPAFSYLNLFINYFLITTTLFFWLMITSRKERKQLVAKVAGSALADRIMAISSQKSSSQFNNRGGAAGNSAAPLSGVVANVVVARVNPT